MQVYLVRYSEKQGRYAISVCFEGEVKHVKIEQSQDGYWLDESQIFPNVVVGNFPFPYGKNRWINYPFPSRI